MERKHVSLAILYNACKYMGVGYIISLYSVEKHNIPLERNNQGKS
jgi:hypothetical protein